MATGVVTEIWRFPVKSMRGERLEGGEISEQGLAGDRRWGVINGETGKVLSAKREGRLLLARAVLPDGSATPLIQLPDGRELSADDPSANELLSQWLDRDVRLQAAETGTPTAYEMHVDNTDEASTVIDITCPPGTFLDAGAVHLLTTSSLAVAHAVQPGSRWDVRRFRPTVLIETDDDGWAEDAWIGSAVRLGPVELFVFAPTVRCAVPTRAQEDLPRDLDIARALNREHGSNLGVYCAVRTPGRISVGDALEVLSSS